MKKQRLFSVGVLSLILLFALAQVYAQRQIKQAGLPIANEKNLQAHFEKILNDKDPEVFENAVKELSDDLGLYMAKHFTLLDYQKEYFSNRRTISRSESEPLVMKSGEKIPSYYSKEHKEAWNEFWDESLRLFRARNDPSRAMTNKHIMCKPKLPIDSGGSTVEGGCIGFGVFASENESGEIEWQICICIIIFGFCFSI